MKRKIILSSLIVLFITTNIFAQSDLPSQATNYIQEHFSDTSIKNSKMDGNEWDVYLDNGTKLEFTTKGAIKEIEGNGNPIPSSVLPKKSVTYLNNNYSGINIKEIEFERSKIEVDLENGLELEFDKKGNFLRIDD